MKITRQNYEHWFIDFIEGNLKPDDEAMVREFVQLNPDLNSELEDLFACKMVPEQTTFQDKYLLKQNQLKAIKGITKFERLSIAYLENELDKNEQKELDKLLLNSDKKKKEFQIIQNTKLSTNNNVVYTSKTSLKKLFIVRNKIQIYKAIYRVAAVLVLLTGLTFLLNQNNKTELTGKRLTKIQTIPELKKAVQNKKTNIIPIKDNKTIALSQNQTEKLENKQMVILPEELVTFKCSAVKYEDIISDSDRFKTSIYNNTYALNNETEKGKIDLNKKIIYIINSAGKSLIKRTKKVLKKKFNYKKSYLDDGRILIAFNVGNFEYKINKKQKNK